MSDLVDQISLAQENRVQLLTARSVVAELETSADGASVVVLWASLTTGASRAAGGCY